MSACPVCGHVDGACAGATRTNERQIITSDGVVKQRGPERVPRPRRTRLGREGYVGDGTGKLEYYDPAAPNITFVEDTDDADDDDEATPLASVDSGAEEGARAAPPGVLVASGDEPEYRRTEAAFDFADKGGGEPSVQPTQRHQDVSSGTPAESEKPKRTRKKKSE